MAASLRANMAANSKPFLTNSVKEKNTVQRNDVIDKVYILAKKKSIKKIVSRYWLKLTATSCVSRHQQKQHISTCYLSLLSNKQLV